MSRLNPYMAIKKANSMPQSLQKEYDSANNNTSLEDNKIIDGRGPLLDAYLDNRLRSNKPITFLSFIDDLRKLWEEAGKTGKIIRKNPNKENAEFPIITYRLVRRIVNTSFKDKKPRYRTTIKHPYMDNEYIDIFGQIFDVWVEFSVYSTSAEEADEMVLEFEEFLQTYAGFFKQKGVQEILFHSQGEDQVITSGRVPVSKRKLSYTMRFEKIIVRFLNEIEQIAIQAKLLNEK